VEERHERGRRLDHDDPLDVDPHAIKQLLE